MGHEEAVSYAMREPENKAVARRKLIFINVTA